MENKTGWKSPKRKANIIVGTEEKPTEFKGGEVIINKKATKKNLDRLIEINNDGSGKVTTDASDGGILKGKPHYDENGNPTGGIPGVVAGSKNIETEGGEFVVNPEASEKHWKELSEINQSTGGVPINNPNGFDDDPQEYSEGGKIKFNANKLPKSSILNYAEMVRTKYPKVWDLGGNIFGNEAFKNLKRVSDRGYWTDNEEWMYIKWRSYVARHQKDFRIAGVIAMLKWVDTVDRGWAYMRKLIDEEIKKRYPKKMKEGGRTIAQTPAPKKDRIKGSITNKPGSSSTTKNASSIKFDENTLTAISNKVKDHNSEHPNKKITLASAKAVVRRGMGAYSSSHRPTIGGGKPNDRTAWGLARLDAFTYKIVHGKSKSGKYTQDDDLINELGYSVSKYHLGGDMTKHLAPNGKPSNLNHEQWHLVRTPEFKAWFGDWEKDPKNASQVVDENGEPLVVYRGDNSASKKGNIFKTGFNRMGFINRDRLPNRFFHYFVDQYNVAKLYAENQVEDHNTEVEYSGKGKKWEAKVTPYFLNIRNAIDITPNNPLFPTFKQYKESVKPTGGYSDPWDTSWGVPFWYGFDISKQYLHKILAEKIGDDYYYDDYYSKESNERRKERILNDTHWGHTFGHFIEWKTQRQNSDWLWFVYQGLLKNKVDGLIFLEQTHWFIESSKEEKLKYEKGLLKLDPEVWRQKPKVYAALHSNQIKLADGTNTTFDGSNPDIRFNNGGKVKTKAFVVFFKSNLLNNIIYTNVDSDSLENAVKEQQSLYSWSDIAWIKGFEKKSANDLQEFFLQNIKEKWETKPELSVRIKNGKIFFNRNKDSVSFYFIPVFEVKDGVRIFKEGYLQHSTTEIYVDSAFNFDRNNIFELMLGRMEDGGNIEYQSRNLSGSMVYYRRKGNEKWEFISKEEFDKNANEMNTIKFESVMLSKLPDVVKKDALDIVLKGGYRYELDKLRNPHKKKFTNFSDEISLDVSYALIYAIFNGLITVENNPGNTHFWVYGYTVIHRDKEGIKEMMDENDFEKYIKLGIVTQNQVDKIIEESGNIQMKDGGPVDDPSKIFSASSRFRPIETIFFDPALVGPNGNKLISYTWKYQWTVDFNKNKGEEIEKRISDWTQAEESAETGRNIVHAYSIEKPNGEVLTVSSESVPVLMGLVDREQKKVFANLATASKTLAKQQMKLAILEAQQKEYEDTKRAIIDAGYPEITIESGWDEDNVRLKMGDGSVRSDASNPLSQERIRVLQDSYVRAELNKRGIDPYKGDVSFQISKLKPLIERQKRKVENIIATEKMADGGPVDSKDTVTVDIPLMIRLLELSREDVNSDAELHMVVERLLDLKNKPVLTMDDYAYIAEIEHKHLKKMELGGNIENEKLISQAHTNLTVKKGRRDYAPTTTEIQEEIDRMIIEGQFGSSNV